MAVAEFESEGDRQRERRKRPPAMIEVESVRRKKRTIALITLWVPMLGTLAAIVLAAYTGVSWLEVSLFVGMYVLTVAGLEAGFHRLFSHKAYTTGKTLRFLHAVAGSMAMQGPILYWVASHRRHHMYSDSHEDPHSPWVRKGEDGQPQHLTGFKGFWHSHVANMYTDYPTNVMAFTRDLGQDPMLRFVDKHYRPWVLLGLLLPAAIGLAVGGTWLFALKGLLWGGLMRICVVHHVFFTNGSFSHLWGSRPFETGDHSANNLWFGVLTFGSAYQNNHHAFPASAVLGFRWYEFDVAALFIRTYELLGIAHNVHKPPHQAARERYARASSARLSSRQPHGEST